MSCSEGIDRTAAGRLVHSMLASVNEYHSRNMGEEIKRTRRGCTNEDALAR